MTTVRDEIKKAALVNNPKNVSFKETNSSLFVIAPDHSAHSAFLDQAFDVARTNGIKYKQHKESPYTVKFY